jgi:chemotaxis protein CheD
MTGNLEKTPTLYLKPGEWFFGRERGLIKTILGSCIAVTMFHRNTRLAAICHALMPACEKKGGCTGYCESHSRYADCIIRRMTEIFFHRGIKAGDIELKLFGGADSFSVDSGGKSPLSVGARNFEQARKSIEKEGLRLSGSDVGGSEGRKLFFDTHTGEVLLKRMNAKTDTGTGRCLVEQFGGGIGSRGKAG